MSQLSIYHLTDKHTPVYKTDVHHEITVQLEKIAVRFERWQASSLINEQTSNEEILTAYQHDIQRLKNESGYCAVDVISLTKGNPNAAQLREKFLFEHTHSEDEVRFFCCRPRALFVCTFTIRCIKYCANWATSFLCQPILLIGLIWVQILNLLPSAYLIMKPAGLHKQLNHL